MLKVRIVKLGEDRSNAEYWAKQSADSRLSHLEELRHEVIMSQYGAIPRLQRVYRIVRRK